MSRGALLVSCITHIKIARQAEEEDSSFALIIDAQVECL